MPLFQKAERFKSKLRLGLTSPAGGGKTHSSLLIAKGLGGRIAVVDTENGSARKEVGKNGVPEFDVLVLEAPFTPDKYISAIKEAEKEGYDIIIIDSLSPAWAGSGGLLERADIITKSSASKNSYMAWREVTPLHNKLIDAILQSKCHVIVTMRSKVEYVVETNDKGKSAPRKVGLAPIQREGMDYEMDIVLDIDQNQHLATASKDRTSIFEGTPFKPSVETGEKLKEWLGTGVEAPPPPIVQPNCSNCAKKNVVTEATKETDGMELCDSCFDKYEEIKKSKV